MNPTYFTILRIGDWLIDDPSRFLQGPIQQYPALLKYTPHNLFEGPIEDLFLFMLEREVIAGDPPGYESDDLPLLNALLEEMDHRKSISHEMGDYDFDGSYLKNRQLSLYGLYDGKEAGMEQLFDTKSQSIEDFSGLIRKEVIQNKQTYDVTLLIQGSCKHCWQYAPRQST